MTGAFYGSTSINSQGTQFAIIDTGTSFLLMAESDYKIFTTQVFLSTEDGFDCSGSYCVSVYKPCDKFVEKLDDIIIYIDNFSYSIPPSGYLMDGLSGIKCSILVSSIQNKEGIYVLGDTFIRNFYSSFNY
jgi:Eukaryotic aspartyl protease